MRATILRLPSYVFIAWCLFKQDVSSLRTGASLALLLNESSNYTAMKSMLHILALSKPKMLTFEVLKQVLVVGESEARTRTYPKVSGLSRL
jgi:hypothetical protein